MILTRNIISFNMSRLTSPCFSNSTSASSDQESIVTSPYFAEISGGSDKGSVKSNLAMADITITSFSEESKPRSSLFIAEKLGNILTKNKSDMITLERLRTPRENNEDIDELVGIPPTVHNDTRHIVKNEEDKESKSEVTSIEEVKSPKKRSGKSPRKPKVKIEYDKLEAPAHWEEVYKNIQLMRADRSAPVDSMGCERAHDPEVEPAVRRFQCLVSLMLSSQTKDEVNYAAMVRLRQHGLTVENIIDTSEEKLGELIFPVGFWRTKAKYIKETCLVLRDKYQGDIPDTVKELCKLKGVGPKMAYLAMNVAWGEQSGIGVDTHVHRIAERLGWTRDCSDPEQTRQCLEAWLPEENWTEINWLLVGFGQQICLPVGPRCDSCLNRQMCPTGQKWVPSPKKKRKSLDKS